MLLLTVRRDQVVLYHLPAQFDGIIMPLLVNPVLVSIYHYEGDLFVKVFNELYDTHHDARTRRPLRKLTVQELLVFGAAMIGTGAVVMYTGLVILLNDMAHLLINNSNLEFLKSSAVAATLTTVLEAWSLAMCALNVGFLLSFNCLVLSKLEVTINGIHGALRYFYDLHVKLIMLLLTVVIIVIMLIVASAPVRFGIPH